jgi:RNA polymerase sigma-70 factor (ECF subfamily)
VLRILLCILDNDKHKKVEDLYTEYASFMYKIAYKILDDKNSAEDAVQEAFVRILKYIDKKKETDCHILKPLIVMITRNVSIDIYRKRKKQIDLSYEDIEETVPDSGLTTEEITIENIISNQIAAKIKELNPSYADIISLKYYYHYNIAEISGILNIAPDNVRTRLHRAKNSLLKLLTSEQEVAIND